MRVGVRLCAGVWRVIGYLLKAILRPRWDLEVPIQKQPCAVQRRDCVGLLPFSSRRGLCAGRPVCQERGAGCTVCAAGCAGLAAGLCGKTEGQLLLLLPWRPRDCPSAASTQRPLLRGLPAQRHRSASLVEEEPHPERHRSSTSWRPRSAALVRILCPCEELQPVESCP